MNFLDPHWHLLLLRLQLNDGAHAQEVLLIVTPDAKGRSLQFTQTPLLPKAMNPNSGGHVEVWSIREIYVSESPSYFAERMFLVVVGCETQRSRALDQMYPCLQGHRLSAEKNSTSSILTC